MLSVSLRERFELPGTVVKIVEIVTILDHDAADLGDGICGLHAATHRAGVDFTRSPAVGNALSNGNGLSVSLGGERDMYENNPP